MAPRSNSGRAPDVLTADFSNIEKNANLSLQGAIRGGLFTAPPIWHTKKHAGLQLEIGYQPAVYAQRELGGLVSVVPFYTDGEFSFWVSIFQRWDVFPRNKWLYATTSITIFIGNPNTTDWRQLFRAEWPGRCKRTTKSFEFEAPSAGNPHWHFDAGRITDPTESDIIVDRLRAELAEESKDFSALDMQPGVSTVTTASNRLGRIHFPNTANWMKNPWDGKSSNIDCHVSQPKSVEEVFNWMSSSLHYIRQELERIC